MIGYFARRLLLVIPTFIGITLAVFVVMQFVPGGPVERQIMRYQMAAMTQGGGGGSIASGRGNSLPEEALQEIRRYYGFDKPVHIRYALWLWNVLHLDLGNSYIYQDPVWDVIKARFPVSIFLGLTGFLLSYLICIPLGVLKAIRHGSRFDVISSLIVFLGYSMPGWALGTGAARAVWRRELLEHLSARRVPVGQLGVSVVRTEDRRSGAPHVPAGGLLHDRRVRDADDPDQELADGEHGAGLRPHGVCEGAA